MRITSCAQSDLGRAREVNEDYHLIESSLGLYLVADGMGGHGHGDVASRIATRVIGRSLHESEPPFRGWSGASAGSEADCDRLRWAIKEANRAVLAEVERDERLTGMGCTLVAMIMGDTRAAVAHVGDSRAYRLRAGRLERVTEDHTWVHEQVAAGLLSESEAMGHPFRSVVTRAVGGGEEVVVDARTVQVESGDLFLLCSDGLNVAVPEDRIEQLLASAEPLETRCRALIAAANEAGGPDNITVVLVALGSDD